MTIDVGIAKILKLDPKMVRFYTARMLIELTRGKPLTRREQKMVYDQCSERRFRVLNT